MGCSKVGGAFAGLVSSVRHTGFLGKIPPTRPACDVVEILAICDHTFIRR